MGMDRFARDMISLREFFLIQPPPAGRKRQGIPEIFAFFCIVISGLLLYDREENRLAGGARRRIGQANGSRASAESLTGGRFCSRKGWMIQ